MDCHSGRRLSVDISTKLGRDRLQREALILAVVAGLGMAATLLLGTAFPSIFTALAG
jgi:hypothetical protein